MNTNNNFACQEENAVHTTQAATFECKLLNIRFWWSCPFTSECLLHMNRFTDKITGQISFLPLSFIFINVFIDFICIYFLWIYLFIY